MGHFRTMDRVGFGCCGGKHDGSSNSDRISPNIVSPEPPGEGSLIALCPGRYLTKGAMKHAVFDMVYPVP